MGGKEEEGAKMTDLEALQSKVEELTRRVKSQGEDIFNLSQQVAQLQRLVEKK